MKASGNKLQGFTILAEISQKSAICKKCKAASCSLTLLEKPNSCRGLGEQFVLLVILKKSFHSSSRKVSPVSKTASKSKAQVRKIYDVNIGQLFKFGNWCWTYLKLFVVILIYHTNSVQRTKHLSTISATLS